MIDLVQAFPDQLEKAVEIAQQSVLHRSPETINRVFIAGLGGSGIGGTIVSELVFNHASCPVYVGKDYFTPSWVNNQTLAVICTYSGNTEETLMVLQECISRQAKICVISSGGKAIETAIATQLDHVVLPAGFPPRSCIGYALVQILNVLVFHKITHNNWLNMVVSSALLLRKEQDNIRASAVEMADRLYNRLPVIYSLGATEGTAVRFRQQLNENSKVLCWHHVFPEMNHNELVGWTVPHPEIAVVVLRFHADYYRSVKRLEVCKEVFGRYTPNIFELHAKGDNPLEETMYMIHLCDYISCYLAVKRGVDAMDISVIDHLKSALARIN